MSLTTDLALTKRVISYVNFNYPISERLIKLINERSLLNQEWTNMCFLYKHLLVRSYSLVF